MKKEDKRLTLEQRRQREAKWLNYRTEQIEEWNTDIKYNQEILDMSPIATTVEILQNYDMNYQRAFDQLGTIETPLEIIDEVKNTPELQPELSNQFFHPNTPSGGQENEIEELEMPEVEDMDKRDAKGVDLSHQVRDMTPEQRLAS